MRIGILTEIINSHSGARAPLEIAKHLRKRGHDVIVYGYNFQLNINTLKDLKKHDVSVRIIPKLNVHFIGKHLTIPRFYKELMKDKPDALTFSGTLPLFIAAKLTRIPILRIYQGVQFDAFLEYKNPNQQITSLDKGINMIANCVIFAIEFMSLRLADGVVAVSKFAATQGEKLFKRKIMAVIYNGTTNLSKYERFNERSSYTTLLSVSRITPYKGFHLLIEALKSVKTQKTLKLVIAGSQPKLNYVNYLKKLGGTLVHFEFDPTDKMLSKLYAHTDIYATADRLLYFGLPVTEAALNKIPTVARDYAAAKEVISHGKTGFVAKSQTEFAGYLEKLIDNSKLRNQLGQAARVRVLKEFTWERAALQYEQILKKLVQHSSS